MTAPDCWIALDPGTRFTGVAVFEKRKLSRYGLIEPPKNLEIEERIAYIVEQLDKAVEPFKWGIQQVVIEKGAGMEKYRPAPQLQTLIIRLRRWATKQPPPWKWVEYHPGTVVSEVRLRGVRIPKGKRKEAIAAGVRGLYGDGLPDGLAQDVIDAIAVGYTHLMKTQELPQEVPT